MTVPVFLMLIPAIVIYLIALFAAIAEQAQAQQQGAPPNPSFILGPMAVYFAMLFVIIMISQVINTFFVFSFPLIAERKMLGWDAVKLSVRAVLGNLGGIIGLVLVLICLQIVSSLLCFIGQILEAPLQVAMMAVAYRQVFPRRDALTRFDADDDPDEPDAPAPQGGASTEVQSLDPGRGRDDGQSTNSRIGSRSSSKNCGRPLKSGNCTFKSIPSVW
ncbi:MAG: hypothetical protein EXR98_19545 [Gemmataceae bacterium]|nr:hypothetical protein [Gemmataceae bacterium]